MNYDEKCKLAKLIVSFSRSKTVEKKKEQIKAQINDLNPSQEEINEILSVVL